MLDPTAVRRMQWILRKLRFGDERLTCSGHLDRPTQEALARFCAHYHLDASASYAEQLRWVCEGPPQEESSDGDVAGPYCRH